MRIINTTILLILLTTSAFGQKYYTRNGYVRFFSKTPMENIEAITNQATCIVDISTGEVVSKMLMESFQFEKALMQEHFNENYVESDKFPQATLKAKISNLTEIDFNSSAPQNVLLEGELTVHGIKKPVSIKGSFIKNNNKFTTTSVFKVKPADYEIKIPKAVINNIANEIEVNLKFDLELFKQPQ